MILSTMRMCSRLLEVGELGLSKPRVVKVDVVKDFITKCMFTLRDHIFKWVRMKATKLVLGINIQSLILVSIKDISFVMMSFERCG